MLGTYIYFDGDKNRLHLFRRDEKFLPVGTIEKVKNGVATINLWAPLVLHSLGAARKSDLEIVVSLTSLSRKQGIRIKRI